MNDNPRDGDAERPVMSPDAYDRADVAIDLAQRRGMGLRLAVAAAIESSYRDALDARDAALREAQRTNQALYAAVMDQKTEIARLREALAVIAGGDGDPQVIAAQTIGIDAAPAGDATNPAGAARAEIVAWLRQPTESKRYIGDHYTAEIRRHAADCIENGDHKRPAAAQREGET